MLLPSYVVVGLALWSAVVTPPAASRAPGPVASADTLATADVRDAARRLVDLIEHLDPANSGALYDAQQEGMALAEAIFRFGSAAQTDSVLQAAVRQIQTLPTVDTLLRDESASRILGRIELLSPLLTRLRQRLTTLHVAVDGLPFPPGELRRRRVFPMVASSEINVSSEVELQYAYLLSTIVRLAVEHPLPPNDPLTERRHTAISTLFGFLLRDKVIFYWRDVPAWHWSGPFPDMRTRLLTKLDASSPRVTSPPWFGAILDHELHLLAIASDLNAVVRQDPRLRRQLSPSDAAALVEIRATTMRMLRERVTHAEQAQGFLIDYGRWTSNPTYAYAGCSRREPIPTSPCPVDSVATDVSHARRWPWWLVSFRDAWPAGDANRALIERYREGLAAQFAQSVLYFDERARPLTKNYMDGRDGWYHFRDFPGQTWGYGPSSMTGSMRYGSWALLSDLNPVIARASRRFCDVISSKDSADVAFRTRYYGSPSARPELAGLGETDLYGASSLYALTCRINAVLMHDGSLD